MQANPASKARQARRQRQDQEERTYRRQKSRQDSADEDYVAQDKYRDVDQDELDAYVSVLILTEAKFVICG